MLKIIYSFTIFILFTTISFGQLNMSSPNNGVTNPILCSSYLLADANFFDNGVSTTSSTNYLNNFNDTITICPDLITNGKITFSSLIATGYIWNIDASDTLYVFDGSSVSAPLVAAINSATNPLGYTYTSSYINPTGCLTFVFHSNASVNNIGWAANIMCVSPPQPIEMNIHAYVNGSTIDALLTDSLFVDICLGDTVTLTIDPQYPNSLESNGYGYSQTDANVSSLWAWTTGETFASVDTVQYIATSSSGFISTIKLTDIYPYVWSRDVYIRVGTIPNFGGLSVTPDTVCLGEQVVLYGGFDSIAHINYGFTIPEGVIAIGGSVAGITYLPDGTGLSYTSTISIGGFAPGQALTSSCSLQSICLEMEHSYIGDLSATITCPNGTVASLFDSYTNFNDNVYLGEPNESDGPIPGIGYDYCFTDGAAATMWTVHDAPGGPVSVPSPPAPSGSTTMPAGSYQPESNFLSTLAGCPLNGPWTITVTDHQAIDNGYIFNWSLNFAACNYAASDSLTYQNYPVSGGYVDVSPILSSTTSTTVTIPLIHGDNPYIFEIIDDFGCPHDTTINAFVHYVDILESDTICSVGSLTMTTNFSDQAGVWSFYGSPGTPVFTSSTNVNTTVTFPTPGVYHLVYSTTTCVTADTATIYFFGYVPFDLNSPFFVCPADNKLFTIGDSLQFASVDWNLGIPAQDTLFSNNLGIGTYTINAIGNNSCAYDTTFTITSQPPVVLNYFSAVCYDTMEMNLNVGPSLTGQWSYIPPNASSSAVFRNIDSLNTGVKIYGYGTYQFIFTEPVCLDDDTLTVTFTPGVYFNLEDSLKLCLGNVQTLSPEILLSDYVSSMLWSTGETEPTINVTAEGNYIFTISNICETMTDSVYITVKNCDIEMPNVFSPNGDGINDLYHIKGDDEIFKEFHIVILNRWGNVINEYNNPSGTWNGTDNSGNYVKTGVYFYKVDSVTLQDEVLEKEGFIHVVY